ncbi:MAG: thiol peroxidase [Actinobacteria bacterium]|nr:thiol peroxidase [Actinomycetota bacterium]MCB9388831.1 thiol peroxidase [Acidimicrobiia bacterium]
MATTALRGNEVHTSGDLPAEGSHAPEFSLTAQDLSPVDLASFSGNKVVLNVFPSIDTPTCATSVRTFNEKAAGLDDTKVICISADLPFALGRFCGAEGIDNVVTASTFRSPNFGDDYGLVMVDGPLAGLMARAVITLDADGNVVHTELVSDIASEPDYDAALESLTS